MANWILFLKGVLICTIGVLITIAVFHFLGIETGHGMGR